MDYIFGLTILFILVVLPTFLLFRSIRGNRVRREIEKANQPKSIYIKNGKIIVSIISIVVFIVVKETTNNFILSVVLAVVSEAALLEILKKN